MPSSLQQSVDFFPSPVRARIALPSKPNSYRTDRVRFQNRTIPLPDEDLDAVGSVLEYLYNGEYFPRRIGDGRDAFLEADPSIPEVDADGSQLLRHARVYTLAEKFGMPVGLLLPFTISYTPC